MEDYEVELCIRGYYVYQDLWTPVIGEELRVKFQ